MRTLKQALDDFQKRVEEEYVSLPGRPEDILLQTNRQQAERIRELEQALVTSSLKLGKQSTGGGNGYDAVIKVENTCSCNQRPTGGYGGGGGNAVVTRTLGCSCCGERK